MTRFARASGSKGSNDKKPEDATSWKEIKAEMLARRYVKPESRSVNNIENEANVPSTEEISSVWAELVSQSDELKKTTKMPSQKKHVKNKFKKEDTSRNNINGDVRTTKKNQISETVIENNETLPQKTAAKKSKKESLAAFSGITKKQIIKMKSKCKADDTSDKSLIIVKKKKKKVNTDLNTEQVETEDNTPKKQIIKNKSKCKADDTIDKSLIIVKKKKKKVDTDLNTEQVETEDNTPLKCIKKRNRKRKRAINSENINGSILSTTKNEEKNLASVANVNKKEGDSNEAEPKVKKRRKEELKPSEVYINGKPVRIAPFDGFLVQAEDAERLRELRKNMKSKGIPENDRERAIKLERRRAEKALARLKKKVCFHCRGSGHNLSECPQVEEDQRSTGICYKCGSTEHTHFQCRVTKSDDYRYAECFICKEQGHIAKQCPDNPRGLYPRGGGCASCGDVTHLKKDCPKYLAEKEDDTVTVGTRNNRALEALDEDLQSHVEIPQKTFSKPNKHIKF